MAPSAHQSAAYARIDGNRVGVGARPRARAAMSPRSREEVFALIRAHLADELDVEPNAIVEGTRFKEDLEADSLDLYTLVQELEDTYKVTMSDDQAAQLVTVGQVVDFVLARDGMADVER